VSTFGIVERVRRIAASLDAAGIPFAVGGAITLNYYIEPRATRDIDLNVFVPEAEATRVLRWAETPVDLFFSVAPYHEWPRNSI